MSSRGESESTVRCGVVRTPRECEGSRDSGDSGDSADSWRVSSRARRFFVCTPLLAEAAAISPHISPNLPMYSASSGGRRERAAARSSAAGRDSSSGSAHPSPPSTRAGACLSCSRRWRRRRKASRPNGQPFQPARGQASLSPQISPDLARSRQISPDLEGRQAGGWLRRQLRPHPRLVRERLALGAFRESSERVPRRGEGGEEGGREGEAERGAYHAACAAAPPASSPYLPRSPQISPYLAPCGMAAGSSAASQLSSKRRHSRPHARSYVWVLKTCLHTQQGAGPRGRTLEPPPPTRTAPPRGKRRCRSWEPRACEGTVREGSERAARVLRTPLRTSHTGHSQRIVSCTLWPMTGSKRRAVVTESRTGPEHAEGQRVGREKWDGRMHRGLGAASCATHRAVRRAAGPRAPRAAPRTPSPAPRGRGSPSPAPSRQRNPEVQPRCNLRGRSELHCASPGCVAPEHTLHAPCSAARAASTGYGRGTAAGSRERSRPRSATAAAA